jgi:hypothetical protein
VQTSLRSLDVCYPRSDAKETRDFTNAVATMLSVNERVEAMSFDDGTFDIGQWNMHVTPPQDSNVISIETDFLRSTRAAVLASALAKVSSKPHLLLNQNHDIVSSYLDSAHDQVSAPSRKRSRSPPLNRGSKVCRSR